MKGWTHLDPEFVFKFSRLFNQTPPSSLLDFSSFSPVSAARRVVPRVLSHLLRETKHNCYQSPRGVNENPRFKVKWGPDGAGERTACQWFTKRCLILNRTLSPNSPRFRLSRETVHSPNNACSPVLSPFISPTN